MARYYFYMRISTAEERGKQKFNRQEKAIQSYCNQNHIQYDDRSVYKDDISGKSFNRPDWNLLNDIVQDGDTIIFKDIARFTRETEAGYAKYMELLNKGVNLVFIDNPTVSTDYIKKMTKIAETQNIVTKTALEGTIKLLLIVELDRVEQERLTISKRIIDGIAASTKKSGRATGKLDKMTDKLKQDIIAYLGDRSIKQNDLMRKHDISRNTLKKYIDIVKKESC